MNAHFLATTCPRRGASQEITFPRRAWERGGLSILLGFVTLLTGFLFFYRLADRDLWSSHEARAAQNAQTILDDGRWGLPRLFDGRAELQKPPFYYWLVAMAARWQGGMVDAWTVRLPAALAGLGGVLALFLLGLCWGRPLAGFVAATVLATFQHYTWIARVGRIDMPLTFAISVALSAYYLARTSDNLASISASPRLRVFALLLTYLAVAAALLLKGPIGVVLPATVVMVHWFVEGRAAPLRVAAKQLGLRWGLPLVLAIAAPWYLWVGAETNGAFYRSFFWYHNVERGWGGSNTLAAHPPWFYGPRLAIDLLPWSPLLLAAGWYFLRQGRWRRDPEARFGLIWLATMFALLSCVQFKRADYLLPAYPGAALFLGCVAERWYRERSSPWFVVPPSGGSEPEDRLKVELRTTGPIAVRSSWNRLRVWRASFGLSFLVFSLVLVPLAWWFYIVHVLPEQEPAREHRRFAAAIRQWAPAPQLVLFFRAEEHALAFHVGRPIDTFLEWENLDIWAGRPGSFYIVMPPDCAEEWPLHVTSGRLEEVLRNTDLVGDHHHEHPLVLMRTRPRAKVLSAEQ